MAVAALVHPVSFVEQHLYGVRDRSGAPRRELHSSRDHAPTIPGAFYKIPQPAFHRRKSFS